MDCASCASTIRTAMERLPGLSDIRISIATERLDMVVDERQADLAGIVGRIEKLGYKARPIARDAPAGPFVAAPSWWRTAKGRIAGAAGLLLAAAALGEQLVPALGEPLYVAATLVAAAPIARRAFQAARAGAPFTIQMLMSIAVLGALLIGAAQEAAVVVFLFCVGEVLEGVAAERARAGIRALAALVPETALLDEDGGPREIAAAQLRIGQRVLVRPGDRVPADGTVVAGRSGVDESPITGESVPVAKEPGSEVFAGSINREAALRVEVRSAASDTTIARIVRLVEESQEAKAPTERVIDRFSRFYMPAIVGLAVLVALVPPLVVGDWSLWTYRALALLLIGCPCALVISVPAAVASSLSAAARQGLLVKGGAVMETLSEIDTIVFDKTGTLTRGVPAVTDVVALEGGASELLARVAGLEGQSSHPLAQAIAHHAASLGLAPLEARHVEAVPGQGMAGEVAGEPVFVGAPRFAAERATLGDPVAQRIAAIEAEGKTVVVVLRGARLSGLIALRDEPRADAASGIAALTAMGIRTVMMTGDNARAGAAIAEALGIEARSQMVPEQKAQAVKALSVGGKVAMVGDGINDAPALASAHVGIAMGGGTHVALEAADAALLRDRVGDVARLLRLSRATMANIRQNIAIALGLKAVFLATTLAGLTGLWIAILADTGGTVLVTLNALRLLGHFRGRRQREPDGVDPAHGPATA
ncbi:heavy metal translocating P-type ATPase [Aurantimonas sp. Leaf443]|uniref:heavy metal translocating P-type ATPase n=1 Tax=Aurantimonas sp. Leaf443 TaxID=1736378 RepID=UPI0006FCC88D|nr:heavy metal translocating P-type ATPase [Aurantimonas sp. Leaf443]KQT87463.1 ATPase [Aurantimonas sp. Leaf443]